MQPLRHTTHTTQFPSLLQSKLIAISPFPYGGVKSQASTEGADFPSAAL